MGKNKETAIQKEQQLKSNEDIIEYIIEILAKNNLSISEAQKILYNTTKRLCMQKIIVSS